jgi:hypothetical protein
VGTVAQDRAPGGNRERIPRAARRRHAVRFAPRAGRCRMKRHVCAEQPHAKYRGPSRLPGCRRGPIISDRPSSRGARICRRSAQRFDPEHASACEVPGTVPGSQDAEEGRSSLIDPRVGAPGFEPGTSASRTQRSTGLSHAPNCLSSPPDHPSGQPDSNRRPQPWQGCALPAELCPRSHRSDLNRRPLDYESSALPLSYGGM